MIRSALVKATTQPIGYFGEEGSFSHFVCEKRFGRLPMISCPTLGEAFEGLHHGQYSQIVVPIENASSGMIADSVDQLIEASQHPTD
ncbi:MAG: prephenate dehydratase domain-containing protein, partial [Verrucomicrobiota bacterium]